MLLLILLTIVNQANSQQVTKNLSGRWKSIETFDGKTMEIIFSANDSSYTEITFDIEGKENSRHKRKYRIINNSTLVLDGELKKNYSKIRFVNNDTIRFQYATKKLREDIPLRFLFTFKRSNK